MTTQMTNLFGFAGGKPPMGFKSGTDPPDVQKKIFFRFDRGFLLTIL
jgi:hypothetical protein